MVWVVMKKRQFFHLGLFSDLNSLLPAAVSPSFLHFQFFRSILSIMNKEIGVSAKSHHIRIYFILMLNIRTIY